jgi:hypothetical protein
MSILADLQGIVGAALGDLFSAAILYETSMDAPDGQGGFSVGRRDAMTCKAIIDTYSDARVVGGVPATDRKVIVLGASLPANVTPSPGYTVRVGQPGKPVTESDRLWTVIAVDRDPAAATWELQAR